MKQKFLLKAMLLLCALIAGSSSVWADEAVFTFNTDAGIAALGIDKPSASAGTNLSTSDAYVVSGVSMTVTNKSGGTATRVWNSSGTLDLRIYSGSSFTFAAPAGYVITSIVLAGSTVNGFSADNGTYTGATGTWGPGNSGPYNSVKLTASGTEKINTITVTYTDPSDTRPATTITISGNETTGYAGEAAATPTATLKAGSTTLDKTITWESSATEVATINSETGAITLVGAGTTNITASFAGDEDYKASSASYSLTVYPSYTSLEEIHSNVTTSEKDVKYTFANEYITFVSSDKKNIYISDGTRGMVVYNSTAYSSDAIVVGARLSGSIKTKYKDYSGTVEFTSISNDDLEDLISGSTSVTAQVKTIDALAKANQGVLVKLEGVEYDQSAGTLKKGENSIKYSTKFNNTALTNEAIYDITGILVMVSNVLNIAPRSEADITPKSVKTAPTSAWYTDNGKGTALTTTTINKADGNVSFFFDTNSDGAVTYESSVAAVATIDENTGEITPVGYGTTTIKATTAATSNFYGSNASFTLTVKDDDVDLILGENITYVAGGSGYREWASVSNLWSGATYAAQTNANATNNVIQIRKQNPSGIVVTGSVGRVKKISVVWSTNPSNTANRKITIYGKNVPYSNGADLYGTDSEKGTSLGEIQYGTSTELTIDNNKNYGFIGIAADGAAYFDQILIEWDKTVVPMTITGATWASFSSAKALDFTGTAVTPYIAKEKDASNVTLSPIAKVPAETGIVVNAAAAGTYAIPVLSDAADETTGNLLKPWLTAGTPTEGTYYTLAAGPKFKKSSGGTLAAGKAYLVLSGSSAPELGVDFGSETTGISAINDSELKVNGEFYNLAGQRVAQPTKGLYIVNGKKVVIK